jgi:hypothetical protein
MPNAVMVIFKEIVEYLKSGYKSRAVFLLTLTLLTILDPVAFAGLVWVLFFAKVAPLSSQFLIVASGVYLGLVSILLVATTNTSLKALKSIALFYLSIGIFFLLKGWMESMGKEFELWPWLLVWIASLGYSLSLFISEWDIDPEIKNSPE